MMLELQMKACGEQLKRWPENKARPGHDFGWCSSRMGRHLVEHTTDCLAESQLPRTGLQHKRSPDTIVLQSFDMPGITIHVQATYPGVTYPK